MIIDSNLIWEIIKILWRIISGASVILTILTFFIPNNIITKYIIKKIKKIQLKKSNLSIQVQQKYNPSEYYEIKEYKKHILNLFSEYGLIADIQDNLIKGNLKRRNFHIKNKFRIPSEEESFFIYTQSVDVKFNKFSDCLNTLFDNVRLLENLNNLTLDCKGMNIRITSPFFKNNVLIELLGDNILGDFTIQKTDNGIFLSYNGELNQETLDKLKDIIISINVF